MDWQADKTITQYITSHLGDCISTELRNNDCFCFLSRILEYKGEKSPIYYHSDHLGSAAYLTNDAGQVSQTLNYLPYGEDWVDLQSGLDYRLGQYTFNGKEKDPESGFHYYGARYYWSELLTGWLSVDPMADKYPGISPYAYCAWNPVKLVDPDGRDGVPYVDKKRKTITVKVDIIFYMANPGHIGRRTIDQWAANLMADISKEWTSHGWTYDYNGEQYRVTFDFSYKFDNTVHGKNDFKFDGKNNRKNYIELSGKSAYRYHAKTGKNKYDHRSVVGANRTGFWYHDTKAAAHEAGHLLFLPDRYHEDDKSASGFSADPGWEGTIMAEPGGRGHVTQRDVEEVLDKLIKINGL